MTCFWDGILAGLSASHRDALRLPPQPRPIHLVSRLQALNAPTPGLLWEGTPLTDKMLEENEAHVREFSPQSLASGYWCSTCDPFLCLLCHTLRVNIVHTYLGHPIQYTHPCADTERTLRFRSNRGHFWAQGAGP